MALTIVYASHSYADVLYGLQCWSGTRAHETVTGMVNDERGWRIDRIPGRPVHRVQGGACVLPLWLLRHGRHVVDLELLMSATDAELLHVQLSRALER